MSRLHWEQPDISPSYGPDGEVDWGNIDSMYFEGASYRLEGDFGKIQLTAKALEIRPIDEHSASAE